MSTDGTEENNQIPSPESPVTEEVQEEQTPVIAQVEEVAIESETNSTLSSSNEQTEITASDEGEGLSKGFNFIYLLHISILTFLH